MESYLQFKVQQDSNILLSNIGYVYVVHRANSDVDLYMPRTSPRGTIQHSLERSEGEMQQGSKELKKKKNKFHDPCL